jgi:putative ABC transport system permease protein
MIITDFKIAVRNILRNKVQSSISILGLGIGLGSIILLQALIVHETTFDKFIPDYRKVNKILFGQESSTQYPLGEAMKKDFPEVLDFFRYYMKNDVLVRTAKNESVEDHNFGFADPSIFKILGVRLIEGVPANSPAEIVLSEKTAKKYFGNNTALGAILKVKINNESLDFLVSGVYEDFPANSTIFPDFIGDLKLIDKIFNAEADRIGEYAETMKKPTFLDWDNFPVYTYVVLDQNSDKKALVSKLQKYREHIKDEKTRVKEYSLQPVSEIYLNSGSIWRGYSYFRIGNITELKYYWSISFLILLISVVNYIFITRAGISDRLREMGTRKVLGASHQNLRRQIILESNLVTLLSLIPAAFVLDPGMTFINNTLHRNVTNEVFTNPIMWLYLISVVLFTGTLSGLLIGYKISKVIPLLLLSGKTSAHSRSKRSNHSFLVLHFSLYIILVAGVLTVSKQIRYSQTSFKGINPRGIILSGLNSKESQAGFMTIKNELEKTPGVEKVAGSSFIPFLTYMFPLNLGNGKDDPIRFDGLIMGEGMTEMLGIEVIEGSSFGTFNPSTYEVLFNESSAKKYDLKAGDKFLGIFHVRGILKDFYSHSTHSSIQPMAILQDNPLKMGLVAIKTNGRNDDAVIKKMHELYAQIAPEEIFEAKYLTDYINDMYSAERDQAKLIGAFSILATVLAIMGLFGIALIRITGKTKEIGLRKVNGASVFEVIILLNKDIVRWVLISMIIGIPVSFYLMSNWQSRFAYKTDLSWWIFADAAISAILIAVLTVSWQSWRAATRNPVDALRYE